MYAVQVGQQSLLLYTCCLLQYIEYALKKKVLTYLIRGCVSNSATHRGLLEETPM